MKLRPRALILIAAMTAAIAARCQEESLPPLSENASNVENVVSAHILRHGADRDWMENPGRRGKATRLEFEAIDQSSVKALSPGVFVALVRLREAGSRKPRRAEFIVDLGGDRRRVTSVHWLGLDERIDYAAAAKRAASAAQPLVAAVKSSPHKGPRQRTTGSLPNLVLNALNEKTVPLAACPTKKCLVVVLSPGNSRCHSAAKNIKTLRDYLNSRGVATKIVVGKDSLGAVRGFAAEFGDDTLLDPGGTVPAEGLPHFYAIYDDGGIIEENARAYEGPVDIAKWARELGLP
ncbi:MAG: hypothetical protein NTY77_09130 [Elusimicrobia bacterium]|nr:hypothetical protein [Elusimicrobiota bacterium]